MQIASHPNIYILDTPGILPPFIDDAEICSKLALTGKINDDEEIISKLEIVKMTICPYFMCLGTIGDSLAGEKEVAQFFLSILNSSEEYKKWENLSIDETDELLAECESGSSVELKRRRQYPSDHTQDFIVNDVRRTIYKQISSFEGDLRNDEDSRRLMRLQMTALRKAFRLTPSALEGEEDGSCLTVCRKILNLYRTGRLGHYTLDSVPN